MVKIVKSREKGYKKEKGYFKKVIFDEEDLTSPGNQVQSMKYEPRAKVEAHYHRIQTEVVYTISGKAEWDVDGKKFITEPGDFVVVGPGEVHTIVNPLDVECHFLTFKINYPKGDPNGDTYWL